MRTKLFVCAVALVGASAGLATAAPVPRTTKSPAAASCPIPSEATCLSMMPITAADRRAKSYLETECGKQHAPVCKPFVDKALKAHFEASSAPTLPMMNLKSTDIPADLRDGKYYAYKGPKPSGMLRKKVGKTVLSRAGLSGVPVARNVSVPAATAAKKHRNPKWDANGQAIESCAEFGYEEVYDWARFTDAAAACKGDEACVLDVAFMKTTPGIARRSLQRKDGKPLAVQFKIKKTGDIPKNDFFSYGSTFVYAQGKSGVFKTPELESLAKMLDQGKDWYSFGCRGKCGDRGFGSEWDFHDQLRKRNATMSDAEHEEYERRKARFRELVDLHRQAVGAERDKIMKKVPKDTAWVLPFDVVTSDPLERYDVMRGFAKAKLDTAKKLVDTLPATQLKRMPGAGIQNKPVARQQGAWHSPAGSAPPIGVLAAPPRRPPTSSAPTKADGTAPKVAVDPCAKKNFDVIYETIGSGPISCKLGEMLREEWDRKQRGQKSCLDLQNDDCDWSPSMFEARFVEGLPYARDQQYQEWRCRHYTDDNFAAPPNNPKNLTEVENYIQTMLEAVIAAKRELDPYDQGQGKAGRKYGEDWDDAEHMGDKDWFAGGYSYDVGWRVEAIGKVDNKICEVEGHAHGGATLDGWLGGSHIAVADGAVAGTVNKGGGHKTTVEAHLKVLGHQVFTPVNETYDQVFDETPFRIGQQLPPGWKPSFTVMAGPVPITGALWGELTYGIRFRFEAASESKSCNVDDLRFGVRTTSDPFVAVDGRAQVGVGITGVISAGIRGALNLVTLSLPLHASIWLKVKNVSNQPQPTLVFDADLALALKTLAGRVSLYVEFFPPLFEEEWELFHWNGLSSEIPLMPKLHAELTLSGMK